MIETVPDTVLPKGILKTKLHRPPVGDDVVARTALLKRLENGANLPLTLVSAPAGYGKTSLVSQWLKGCECPAAWISLDHSEAELREFLTYLIVAIESLFPDSLSVLSGHLTAQSLPPHRVLVEDLSNGLADIGENYVVALDDFHSIAGGPAVEFLDTLLEHPPRGMHLVVLCRRDPALKLRQYRANHQMNEFRARDLRLSQKEADIFLQRVSGTRLDRSAVDRIYAGTEGWPVGLRLAALAIRYANNPNLLEAFKGDTAGTQEYLMDEILSGLPPATSEAVERVSILERFCAPLCEILLSDNSKLGNAIGDNCIEDLLDSGLMIVPLDEHNYWFRFHHLFRELLHQQLSKRKPADEIKNLHLVAAQWFRAEGLVEEAVEHNLIAGNGLEAAVDVVRARQQLMADEQWHRLSRLLEQLPHHVRKSDPDLLLLQAWVENHRSNNEGMFSNILEMQKILSECPGGSKAVTEPQRSELDLFNGWKQYTVGNIGEAVELSSHALENLPPTFGFQRGYTYYLLSLYIAAQGNPEKALDIIVQGLNEFESGYPMTRGRLFVAKTMLEYLIGDFANLELTANLAIRFSREQHLPDTFENVISYFGAGLYQLNRLDESGQLLSQLTGNRSYNNGFAHKRGIISHCMVHAANGSFEEALNLLDSKVSELLENGITEYLPALQSFRALLYVRMGRAADAFSWARSFEPDRALDAEFVYSPVLGLIEILICEGSDEALERAEALLSEVLGQFRRANRLLYEAETHVLMAMLASVKGLETEAVENLECAVSLTQPGRMIRLYADRGIVLIPLLNRLQLDGDGLRYIGEILSAFKMGDPSLPGNDRVPATVDKEAYPAEVLSKRELQILELMARHNTNKEIAELLFISPGTVRRHAENIYQKLGVHKRMDAVSKATGLGIL